MIVLGQVANGEILGMSFGDVFSIFYKIMVS